MAPIDHSLDPTEQCYTNFYMKGAKGVWGCRIRIRSYIYIHTHTQFRKTYHTMKIARLWERWHELRMNMDRRESLSYACLKKPRGVLSIEFSLLTSIFMFYDVYRFPSPEGKFERASVPTKCHFPTAHLAPNMPRRTEAELLRVHGAFFQVKSASLSND